MSSDALFYIDENGEKQDKNIHEAWLAEGDERAARMAGYEAARASGMSEELIRFIYPDLVDGAIHDTESDGAIHDTESDDSDQASE
jgi:anti-sigma factor RsiW